MSFSTRLWDTMNWASSFVGFAELNIGVADEPAITIANLILQTVMSPPFKWPWNRNKQQFFLSANVQDYTQSFTDWGYLECFSVQPGFQIASASRTSGVVTLVGTGIDPNYFQQGANFSIANSILGLNVANATVTGATPTSLTYASAGSNLASAPEGPLASAGLVNLNNNQAQAFPPEVKYEALTEATETGRPSSVSQQFSDPGDEASVTFRFLSVPDTSYRAIVTYQKSVTQFFSIAQTWGIPDYLEYVYSYGFLGLAMDYFDDPRGGRYHQMFIAALLSRADGLSATDKNLFLGNWDALRQQWASSDIKTQQGAQARGSM